MEVIRMAEMRCWTMKKRLWIMLLGIMALCLLGSVSLAETRATTYTITTEAFPAEGGFVSGAGTFGWQSTVTLSASAADSIQGGMFSASNVKLIVYQFLQGRYL